MDSKVAKFYSFTGISEDKDMLNILQIVRPALRQRGYIVLEIPFADEEIGALSKAPVVIQYYKKSGHCATMEMHWVIF